MATVSPREESDRAIFMARYARTSDPQDACPIEWYNCSIQADDCTREAATNCCDCGQPICLECGVEVPEGHRCFECVDASASLHSGVRNSGTRDASVGGLLRSSNATGSLVRDGAQFPKRQWAPAGLVAKVLRFPQLAQAFRVGHLFIIAPKSRNHRVLAAFLFLQLCDLLTTLWAFHKGGVELNPVVRFFFPALGAVAGVFLVKLAACALAFRFRRGAPLYVVTAAYCLVVAWNTAVVLA